MISLKSLKMPIRY